MSTILVVDDEPVVRTFLKRQLEDEYDVIEAATAVEALERCRNHS